MICNLKLNIIKIADYGDYKIIFLQWKPFEVISDDTLKAA